MEQHHEKLSQAGLAVVAVGIGKPAHARRYCGRLAPSIACLCDTTLAAYRTYGFGHSRIDSADTLQILAGGVRAALSGQVQGMATGNTRMMGGTFLIDSAGLVRWAHYDRFPGDHADLDQVVELVQQGVLD